MKGPNDVGFLTNVTDVAAWSNNHSIAVKSDGTVWTWGNRYRGGTLGDGMTSGWAYTPVQVKDESGTGFLTNAVPVAGGSNHTLAVMKDGTVRAWGYNGAGQLGDGTFADKSIPVQVKVNDVRAVDGGNNHTVALTSDRSVWTWGHNEYGQLGDGTIVTWRSTPVTVVFPDPPPPDTTVPKVTSTVSKANAKGVAPTANVKATFSEDMTASTINRTTFTLRKQGTTTKVAGITSYDPTTDTATLDPTNSLKRGATYIAAVNIEAEDLAGNPLDQNASLSGPQVHRWTFKVKN